MYSFRPAVTITLTSPDDEHHYEDEYCNFYQEHQDMLPPDLTSVDVEQAAIKIQQVYRGFHVSTPLLSIDVLICKSVVQMIIAGLFRKLTMVVNVIRCLLHIH